MTHPARTPELSKPSAVNCCCSYGAAVSGEWPEFECDDCPKHQAAFGFTGYRCTRHRKEADNR